MDTKCAARGAEAYNRLRSLASIDYSVGESVLPMLEKIKYIAAYQTQPISAVTHYAPVSRIEPYGEGGKYRVIFAEKAKEIGPIPYGDAPMGAMQGPRYTSFAKLQTATKLTELLGKS